MREGDNHLPALGRAMYAIGLAAMMDGATFKLNPHSLPYTHYPCVRCNRKAGTRVVCKCAQEVSDGK